MTNSPNNILVIRLSSIGDILLATPLLRLLRRRFPHARIDFVIKKQFYDVMRTNPNVDHIYQIDASTPGVSTPDRALSPVRGSLSSPVRVSRMRKILRAQPYDLVVDIHDNFRSHYLRQIRGAKILTVKKYKLARFFLVKFGWNFYRGVVPVHQRYINTLKPFGLVDDGLGLEFYPDPQVESAVREKLRAAGFDFSKPTVCIAPGASFATKRWPIEYFADVAKKLLDQFDVQILLLGDKHDAELTRTIAQLDNQRIFDLAGKLDLMLSACALNAADIMLTNDTGLMHLATALKKPTVAIFGSTVRELGFFPVGEKTVVIENAGLSCRPCTHIGRHSCPKKHFKCMRDIPPQRVYEQLASLLKVQSQG